MDGELNNLSFKRYIRFVTSRTAASTNEDLLPDDEMEEEKGRLFFFLLLFFFSFVQAMTSGKQSEDFCFRSENDDTFFQEM